MRAADPRSRPGSTATTQGTTLRADTELSWAVEEDGVVVGDADQPEDVVDFTTQ